MTSSFIIHQSFKSLFTNSSHIKFGRYLSLFSLPIQLDYFGVTCISHMYQTGLFWSNLLNLPTLSTELSNIKRPYWVELV
jgi:hypothetical protein